MLMASVQRSSMGIPITRVSKNKKPKGGTKLTGPSNPQDGEGMLQPLAASILMKLLYVARMARYDLLRPVCRLATFVTKWTPECDKRIFKLMCYVQSTLHYRMTGFVGDKWETL